LLRSLFFGLGVLFGFVAPMAAPELAARVYRSGTELFLNAELSGAFPDSAIELAEAGTVVAFELEVRVKGSSSSVVARRSLSYDLGRREWIVGLGSDKGAKPVPDRFAALLLASSVWALGLGSVSTFDSGGTISIKARPGIIDEAGSWHDAGILWGYVEPGRSFSFASAEEIPR